MFSKNFLYGVLHHLSHNGRTLLFSMESFWAFVESCRWRKGDLTAGKLNIKRCARGAVFTSDLYVKSWRPTHTLNIEQNSNINIKRPWTMTSGGNLQPNRAKDTRYDIDMKSPATSRYILGRQAGTRQGVPKSTSVSIETPFSLVLSALPTQPAACASAFHK